MEYTLHSKKRAHERGIPRYIVELATRLNPKYFCSIPTKKNNYKKRIFFDVNLQFALHDEKISKYEFSLLKNICLVFNEDESKLITVYKFNKREYNKMDNGIVIESAVYPSESGSVIESFNDWFNNISKQFYQESQQELKIL